jgi:Flp pilus assembly protein TadG
MSLPAAAPGPFRIALHRFRRNRRGSAAVEFALVAPIFFALLFAILETALVFLAGQVLETVTHDSARKILTGQAQAAKYTQGEFKDKVVCPDNALAKVLFKCTDLHIDVQSYPAFTSVKIIDPIAGGNFLPAMNYNPGVAGDIVVVRLFYQWPLFVTGLGLDITNLSGSKRLLSATAAFRNEPF